MPDTDQPALLTAFGAPPARARVALRLRSPAERLGRAVLAAGACWTLAVVTLFVPVAHLVLVPGFLIAGAVLGASRLRERQTLLRVRGACPRCGVEQDWGTRGRFYQDRPVDCPRCRNQLRVRLVEGGS
jgi:hypothetical protein